jgi:predicted Holliday junction resolvase-like endonuclease
MHFIYIITIITLIVCFLRSAHRKTIESIKLKKEIESLLSSKTNLLLAIESLQKENSESKEKVISLNVNVNKHIQQIADLKIETSNLEHAIKQNNLKHKTDLEEAVQTARKDSLKRSRSVLRGQATEHLAPYILKDTNPKDYRFLGNPIDYVCFEGLSDLLDGKTNEIISVHFIDIKTGKATLNKSQRRIRDAIKDSRVQFSIINLDKEIEKQDDKIKQKYEAESIKES